MKFSDKVKEIFLSGGQTVLAMNEGYTRKTFLVRMPKGYEVKFDGLWFEFIILQNYFEADFLSTASYHNGGLSSVKKIARAQHKEFIGEGGNRPYSREQNIV